MNYFLWFFPFKKMLKTSTENRNRSLRLHRWHEAGNDDFVLRCVGVERRKSKKNEKRFSRKENIQ